MAATQSLPIMKRKKETLEASTFPRTYFLLDVRWVAATLTSDPRAKKKMFIFHIHDFELYPFQKENFPMNLRNFCCRGV